MMSKVVLYIATSQNGFIADEHGGVDWLPQPKNDEDLVNFGYHDLMLRIDTILMGRKSFEQVKGFGDWAWPDKKTYVFTSKIIEPNLPSVAITHDDPVMFMNALRAHKSAKDILLLGGAALAKSFDQANLIDEIILTIVPQVLESGIALDVDLNNYDLKSEELLRDGMIQKCYVLKAL